MESRPDPKLLEGLPAVSAQEQDAPVGKVASQVKEQAGRSTVYPLQVVEKDQDGKTVRDRKQQAVGLFVKI